MAETFEAYRNRVLSYLGDEEPIGVQQATRSQLELDCATRAGCNLQSALTGAKHAGSISQILLVA
jgi:hypothetical protein